jgi:[ribosomal protein S5]-alanine N-acetyltransferase
MKKHSSSTSQDIADQPILYTTRLVLWPLTVADADSLFLRYTNVDVCRHYDKPPIHHRSETEAFIRHITTGDNVVFNVALVNAPDTVIGDCALHDWDKEAGSVEMGGSLMPHHWGKGLMQEALSKLSDFAKTRFGVHTLVLKTTNRNTQAIRLAQKMGFVIYAECGNETVLQRRY